MLLSIYNGVIRHSTGFELSLESAVRLIREKSVVIQCECNDCTLRGRGKCGVADVVWADDGSAKIECETLTHANIASIRKAMRGR